MSGVNIRVVVPSDPWLMYILSAQVIRIPLQESEQNCSIFSGMLISSFTGALIS